MTEETCKEIDDAARDFADTYMQAEWSVLPALSASEHDDIYCSALDAFRAGYAHAVKGIADLKDGSKANYHRAIEAEKERDELLAKLDGIADNIVDSARLHQSLSRPHPLEKVIAELRDQNGVLSKKLTAYEDALTTIANLPPTADVSGKMKMIAKECLK